MRRETNRRVSRRLVAGLTMLLTTLPAACSPRRSKVVSPPTFSSTAALTKPPLAERLARATASSTFATVSDRRPAGSPDDWRPESPPREWNFIILHHSGAAVGDVESIEADHRRRRDSEGRPWMGIGYHFVIGNGRGMADGQVEPTFRWRGQLHGAHAGDRRYNQEGIGVCLVGDFNTAPPTPLQIAALERLVAWLASRYSIDRESILRHSDVAATECPGTQFPWDSLFRRETGTLVP